jgi:hypothetical protein
MKQDTPFTPVNIDFLGAVGVDGLHHESGRVVFSILELIDRS